MICYHLDVILIMKSLKRFEEFNQFDDPINIQSLRERQVSPKLHSNASEYIQNAYFFGKRALEGLDSTQLKLCCPNLSIIVLFCYGLYSVALKRGTMVCRRRYLIAYKTLEAIHNYK